MYRSLIGLSLLAGAHAQCSVTLPDNTLVGDCGSTMAGGSTCILACATDYDKFTSDATASCSAEGVFSASIDCQAVVYGCRESAACNYNENANTGYVSGGDTSHICIYSVQYGICASCAGSSTDGTGTVDVNDDDGDEVCNNAEVTGCTDNTKCNYDASATDDDGSCIVNDECGVCGGSNQPSIGFFCENGGQTEISVCQDGFYQTAAHTPTSDRECTLKQCTCENGIGATGDACPINGDAKCASCTGEFYLNGIECTAWDTCESSEYVTQVPDNDQNRECATKECTCVSGVGAEGTQCPTHADAKCASCTGEFYLNDIECTAWTVCADGYHEIVIPSNTVNRECTENNCVVTLDVDDNGSDGNFYCRHGDISGVTGSCSCTCKAGFEGTNCDVCPAGKGVSDGVCAACEYPQANPDATHTSACVSQTCANGFGVLVDDFDPTLNPTDQSTANCEECPASYISPTGSGICRLDTDGDDIADIDDTDDDNDGVLDGDDDAPLNALVCKDTDGDGCDDCSVTGQSATASVTTDPSVSNDGADHDGDGTCDFGDPDIDDDGALNDADSNDFNANVCSDTDGDNCDDCSSGTFAPASDGLDTDGDGLCDAGDPDIDDDGALNAADSNDFNANVCSDTDGDNCDDCSSGTFAPTSDGLDTDGDGLCDAGDPDIDDDGALNAADSNDFNANVCSDTDGDNCDDCSSGTFAPGNDGLDTDGDGQCDASDPDKDGDGILNVDEQDGTSIGKDCTILVDCDDDGVDDIKEVEGCILLIDCDEDGLSDSEEITEGTNTTDADTDGDGISDGLEVESHGTDALSPDSDGDGLRDDVELNDNNTHTDAMLSDTDGDGVKDDLDLCHGTDDYDCCHAQKELGNAERYIELQCCVGNTASCDIPLPLSAPTPPPASTCWVRPAPDTVTDLDNDSGEPKYGRTCGGVVWGDDYKDIDVSINFYENLQGFGDACEDFCESDQIIVVYHGTPTMCYCVESCPNESDGGVSNYHIIKNTCDE